MTNFKKIDTLVGAIQRLKNTASFWKRYNKEKYKDFNKKVKKAKQDIIIELEKQGFENRFRTNRYGSIYQPDENFNDEWTKHHYKYNLEKNKFYI